MFLMVSFLKLSLKNAGLCFLDLDIYIISFGSNKLLIIYLFVYLFFYHFYLFIYVFIHSSIFMYLFIYLFIYFFFLNLLIYFTKHYIINSLYINKPI